MNRFLSHVLGAAAAFVVLVGIPGCSSDDGEGKTTSPETSRDGTEGTGGSGGSRKPRSGGSGGGDSSESSSSSSDDASYGFCLGGSGWTCPTAAAKSDCVKGKCGACKKDPSQCSSGDEGSGDGEGGGDDGSGGGDDGSGGGDDDGF